MPKRKEGCGEQHGSGQRCRRIAQESTGIIRILVMVDGVEFYAESIFAVRTGVQGVF